MTIFGRPKQNINATLQFKLRRSQFQACRRDSNDLELELFRWLHIIGNAVKDCINIVFPKTVLRCCISGHGNIVVVALSLGLFNGRIDSIKGGLKVTAID